MSHLLHRRIGRRTILKQGAGLLVAPLILPRIGLKAASDRINVASIGVGIMGNGNMRRMLSNPDLQLVAVCDVDEWRLNDARDTVETAYAAETKRGNYKGVSATKDFREILARPDIDAVLIATGDRWHAVISTMAARAGKDVYCEKPVSLTIHESRVMVDTFRRHNRMFQGGFQQRSVDDFAAARRLIQNGRIGTLKNHLLQLVRNQPGPQSSTGDSASRPRLGYVARPRAVPSLQQPLPPDRSTRLSNRTVGYPAGFRGRQHHLQWLASSGYRAVGDGHGRQRPD